LGRSKHTLTDFGNTRGWVGGMAYEYRQPGMVETLAPGERAG